MTKKRLFIGIKIPNKIKKEIVGIKRDLEKRFARVKWVNDKNLHITVAFLGYINEDKIEKIKDKIELLTEIKPFNLTILKPKIYSSRVLLIDLEDKSGSFKNLQENLTGEIKKLDINAKTSSPHITLGRIANPASPAGRPSGLQIKQLKYAVAALSRVTNPTGWIKVDKITLFESKLSRKGPIYKEVKSFKL